MREPEELYAEIVRRLEGDRTRGDFAGVHVCPPSTSEVPDDPTARLVILKPEQGHKRGRDDSPGRVAAAEFLAQRGNSPRLNRNTLVFLAPDEKELENLLTAAASFLAWSSILADKQSLNLDQFQLAQAESKKEEMDRTVDLRIGATWIHALVPIQHDPAEEVSWEEVRVTGNDSLAKRTGAKLILDETLLPMIGGVRLRMTLDKYLWAERDHVTVGELCEWFPRYLYLPRVKGRDTILEAVRDGASLLTPEDAFATAEELRRGHWSLSRATSRAAGCRPRSTTTPAWSRFRLRANRWKRTRRSAGTLVNVRRHHSGTSRRWKRSWPEGGGPNAAARRYPRSPLPFVGSVKLNGARVGRDAGRIADEVIAHLAALPGATVDVTLEVHVRVSDGVEEDVVGTVSENATALKFDHASFEKD